jgi:5-methylcytosine-specific restriction endonuclease McrA
MRIEKRTYNDRREYLAKATNKRRRRLKKLMVDYKSGKCHFCGYANYIGALDFHHVDPKTKRFSLSMDQMYRSWKITKKELDKCVIVCSNCHRELHAGLLELNKNLSSNSASEML